MVCTIVNPLHEIFSPISVCTMCVTVCVCMCMCILHIVMLEPFLTCTLCYSVLVFVKLRITFSISVHYVCYVCSAL